MIREGEAIQGRRRALGLTQKDLARLAGIPQPNLSNIEKGKQDMTIATLRRLGRTLDFSLSGFFGELEREEEKFVFSRAAVERIAGAIVKGPRSAVTRSPALNKAERRIAGLFCRILPLPKNQKARVREIQQAWMTLRRCLPAEGIRTLLERIRDAELRAKGVA